MAELNWIPIEERLPTESDVNESMLYGVTVDGNVMPVHIVHFNTSTKRYTHWLPFREMPVPKRWRVPTIHDLAKAGKPIPCRVRCQGAWQNSFLNAIDADSKIVAAFYCNGSWFEFCEICDE